MKRLVVIFCMLTFTASAQQPIPTPDQRLALEIAQLYLRNAHLQTELEKARAEIEAMKAKSQPEIKH
jgi:hypothetical protein